MAAVTKVLFGSWPMANMMLGVTLVSFAGYGIGQFAAPYFIRTFGLDYATVGLIFGLDRRPLGRRSAPWPAALSAISPASRDARAAGMP